MIRNTIQSDPAEFSTVLPTGALPGILGKAGRGAARWAPMLAVMALLGAGCGGDAESREDASGEPVDREESVEQGVRGSAATDGAVRSERAAPPRRALAAGTSLVFEVTEEVSTSSHQAGDVFALRLIQPVSGSGGLTLEAGTPAQGIVTNAQRSDDPEEEALLAVRIESIRVDGRTRALNGTVTGADVEGDAGDSRTRSAAKVATGAAAGAVIGQILGRDTRSTVTGAAVGTVAGLGVALTTRSGHAVLPAGARITVRLDDSLVVD